MDILLEFLQINAGWVCSVALTFFAFMQWWLNRNQMIQSLRFKRLEFAQQLDSIAVTFQGDRDSVVQIIEFMAKNQSNFKFLLKKKDYKYVENLFNFLMEVRKSRFISEEDVLNNLVIFNKYTNSLTDVLCNADYGMVKYNQNDKSLIKNKEIAEK